MNVKIFFETLADLYAHQHNVEVVSVKIKEKDSPRAS